MDYPELFIFNNTKKQFTILGSGSGSNISSPMRIGFEEYNWSFADEIVVDQFMGIVKCQGGDLLMASKYEEEYREKCNRYESEWLSNFSYLHVCEFTVGSWTYFEQFQ